MIISLIILIKFGSTPQPILLIIIHASLGQPKSSILKSSCLKMFKHAGTHVFVILTCCIHTWNKISFPFLLGCKADVLGLGTSFPFQFYSSDKPGIPWFPAYSSPIPTPLSIKTSACVHYLHL